MYMALRTFQIKIMSPNPDNNSNKKHEDFHIKHLEDKYSLFKIITYDQTKVFYEGFKVAENPESNYLHFQM